MRHRVAGKKLNRNSSHRKALSRNLMRAMIIEWQGKGHIVTTKTKAKYIQPQMEKMISLAREKTVHNIRRAMAVIGDRDVVQVLFDEIGPYYQQRPGGYTRILRLVKPRLGDATVRAYFGFVREDDEFPEGDRRAKASAEGTATTSEAEESAELSQEEVSSEDQSADPVASAEVEEASDSEGDAGEESSSEDPANEEETPKS
ncbi:50S ribosomal protein L17 [Planctomycetota bacterium]|nr:50S ribosomal protein L17 [Planctomycetota bacterium]